MKVFDDVRAGDAIIFCKALIHTGTPNRSSKTCKTIAAHLGRAGSLVFPAYQHRLEILARLTERQRRIMEPTSRAGRWLYVGLKPGNASGVVPVCANSPEFRASPTLKWPRDNVGDPTHQPQVYDGLPDRTAARMAPASAEAT